jgi:hypothetical protein
VLLVEPVLLLLLEPESPGEVQPVTASDAKPSATSMHAVEKIRNNFIECLLEALGVAGVAYCRAAGAASRRSLRVRRLAQRGPPDSAKPNCSPRYVRCYKG